MEDYSLNQDNVVKYIEAVCQDENQKDALKKFFKISRYVSATEFQSSLRDVLIKFNPVNYAACLFTIDFGPVTDKSNFWVYNLLIEMGMTPPSIIINGKKDIIKSINMGIKNFVFFDDGSYSGYQIFDVVYTTFLSHILKHDYIDINVSILIPYISKRALNIFNMIIPGKEIIVPMKELIHAFDEKKLMEINNKLKGRVNMNIVYSNVILTLKELLDSASLNELEKMGIRDHKIPIYFSHKMPDDLSSYGDIYIGFTLKEPYDVIPLINNSEKYYNKDLLDYIKTKEDIEDYVKDAPFPRPPYKKLL